MTNKQKSEIVGASILIFVLGIVIGLKLSEFQHNSLFNNIWGILIILGLAIGGFLFIKD